MTGYIEAEIIGGIKVLVPALRKDCGMITPYFAATIGRLRRKRAALAAGAGSAETSEPSAQSEGRQSGPQGDAQ